jgi:hypothetical protein
MHRLAPLSLLCACSDYEYQHIKTIDTFEQGDPGEGVDILWIVDDSGTMIEEQALLTGQFAAFAEILAQAGIDYQVGVVSTDLDAGGVLVGPVIDQDTPDLVDAFTDQASLGTYGSRDEQPLAVMAAAVVATTNPGFVRPGYGLHVIILTDEDDHSRDEVSTYLAAVSGAKGTDPWRISAVAGNEPDGCHSSFASAEVATRVLEAVDTTGGDFHSICSPDFEPVLSSLALTTTGLSFSFTLGALPQPGSIEVEVDGVLVHERTLDGWHYDVGDNAIVFEGYAVPRAGQTVRVSYYEMTITPDTGGEG